MVVVVPYNIFFFVLLCRPLGGGLSLLPVLHEGPLVAIDGRVGPVHPHLVRVGPVLAAEVVRAAEHAWIPPGGR